MSETQNDTTKEIRLRMIPVLADAKDHLGSFDKLAQEIFLACKASDHIDPKELKPIDRRKLKSLIEGEDVALRISELLALDEYLRPRGEGLATKPLIQESAILPSLSRSERVTMLLGSYPRDDDRRIDISSWDHRSLNVLSRNLYHNNQNLRIETEEVVYKTDNEKQSPTELEWRRLLSRDDRSVVFIGSPRVSHATERALAEMFGVKPFERPNLMARRVPFYFVWPEKADPFSSAFAVPLDEVEDINKNLHKEVEDKSKDTIAMVLGDDLRIVKRNKKTWNTYGIIAAQRRREGGIWLVICGLSGPATFGAARAVRAITKELPSSNGKNATILWALVETAVEKGNMRGDQRRVVDQSIVYTKVTRLSP